MSEHKQAVKMSDPNNGIAPHMAKSQHSTDWTEAKVVKSVLGKENNGSHQNQKRSKCSMNLNKGLLLPSV